jgi:hypothetical protein
MMAVRRNSIHEEYVRYAEHCLAMAKIAPDRKSRIIQREMAAEWLNLAGPAAHHSSSNGMSAETFPEAM